jgi:hypothetical protein
MALTASENKQLARLAAERLDRLYACPGPVPNEIDDGDDMLCRFCWFSVYAIAGGWRHSESAVKTMRVLAGTEWPR